MADQAPHPLSLANTQQAELRFDQAPSSLTINHGALKLPYRDSLCGRPQHSLPCHLHLPGPRCAHPSCKGRAVTPASAWSTLPGCRQKRTGMAERTAPSCFLSLLFISFLATQRQLIQLSPSGQTPPTFPGGTDRPTPLPLGLSPMCLSTWPGLFWRGWSPRTDPVPRQVAQLMWSGFHGGGRKGLCLSGPQFSRDSTRVCWNLPRVTPF